MVAPCVNGLQSSRIQVISIYYIYKLILIFSGVVLLILLVANVYIVKLFVFAIDDLSMLNECKACAAISETFLNVKASILGHSISMKISIVTKPRVVCTYTYCSYKRFYIILLTLVSSIFANHRTN